MIINVRDYVDRWMNDYIIYRGQHFKYYGDLNYGSLYFDQKYKEQIGKMSDEAWESQAAVMQGKLRSQAADAAGGIQILDALQSGGLLESTLDEIARGINEGIEIYKDSVGMENYEDILVQAHTFDNALSGGSMSPEQVNEFFDLLLKGIRQAGRFDIQLLDGLTDIGRLLSGTKDFQINQSWRRKAVKSVTKEDLAMAEEIMTYLSNAAKKLQANGVVGVDSFRGTITNIFQKSIGEKVSKVLLAKGIAAGVRQADSILDQMTKRPIGKGRLSWVDKGKFTLGGTKKDTSGKTSKVDIFNEKAFTLTLQENGDTYIIEIGTNTSAKWKTSAGTNDYIKLVSNTSLGDIFKSGTPEHYLAYNIITHKKDGAEFENAFRSLRASTAASFFNEWLSGNGFGIAGSKVFNNKVQFLMVNGKVYSVMRIIRNICNDLAKRNSWGNMPYSIALPTSGISNQWTGSKAPNVSDAMMRSKAVNEVINTLVISASLNSNILQKYAY